MKLSAPKNITFLVALILGVAGLIGQFVDIPFVTDNAFWVEFIAFALLALGSFFKGL